MKRACVGLFGWIAVGSLEAQPTPPPGVAFGAGFQPGSQTLFALDLSSTPVGESPANLKLSRGNLEVVLQGGGRVLKATSASEFLITLPQVLPQDFTLEFDLIPKAGGPPPDLSFEGTPTINQGAGSAHLLWQTDYLAVIGGAQDNYETPMPEDLKTTLPGMLTRVGVSFSGSTIKLYTNGRRLYTLDRVFAKGRYLRVSLGGVDDANAVYLAGLRIATGAPAAGIAQQGGVGSAGAGTGAGGGAGPGSGGSQTTSQSQALSGNTNRVVPNVAVTQGTGGPLVTWGLLGGVTSYAVKRWKIDDATCCNASSAPLSGSPWQDGALPVAGTYVFEVTATAPGWTATGQAQFVQFQSPGRIATVAPPPAPAPPPSPATSPAATSGVTGVTPSGSAAAGTSPIRYLIPPPPRTVVVSGISATGGASTVLPRTLVLSGVSATGGASRIAPRTVALAGITAAGGGIRVSTKVVGTSTTVIPGPRTISLSAIAAVGQSTSVLPRTVALTGLTAKGGSAAIAPRTVSLTGWTAVGPIP